MATRMTNDPLDPCGYCVGWDESEVKDPNIDEPRPVWPDGSTVERMYRFVHEECQASVMRYVEEARRERGGWLHPGDEGYPYEEVTR